MTDGGWASSKTARDLSFRQQLYAVQILILRVSNNDQVYPPYSGPSGVTDVGHHIEHLPGTDKCPPGIAKGSCKHVSQQAVHQGCRTAIYYIFSAYHRAASIQTSNMGQQESLRLNTQTPQRRREDTDRPGRAAGQAASDGVDGVTVDAKRDTSRTESSQARPAPVRADQKQQGAAQGRLAHHQGHVPLHLAQE